jgi:hypothetical protein
MATLEHAVSEITKALVARGTDPSPAETLALMAVSFEPHRLSKEMRELFVVTDPMVAFKCLTVEIGRLFLVDEKALRTFCARHIEAAYGKRRHEYDSLRAALDSARWQVTDAIVKLGNTEAEAQKAVRKVWSSALAAERDKRGMKRAMMKGW